MGKPDFTQAWTAAMSILTAFTVASILTTQVVTKLLSLSSVYSRYLYGTTHDLPQTKEEIAAVKAAFAADEHILDPAPKQLESIRGGGASAGALAVRDPLEGAYGK